MPESNASRMLRPETLTALVTIAAASALLFPTASLRPISALLPGAMLAALLVLSLLLLISDQRKATKGETAKPMTKSPKRVMGAFLITFAYVLSVDLIGFYLSTALFVPLVAFVFGYRRPVGLGLATVIVLAAIYLIFGYAMAQEFPIGRLWPQ